MSFRIIIVLFYPVNKSQQQAKEKLPVILTGNTHITKNQNRALVISVFFHRFPRNANCWKSFAAVRK